MRRQKYRATAQILNEKALRNLDGGHVNQMNVFVYGTLRKHDSNHRLLAAAESVAMQCRVRGRLFHTQYDYPAMIADPTAWTYGEVYRVNDEELAALDELEDYYGPGQDNLYDRIVVDVETDSGHITAYAYQYCDVNEVLGLPQVAFGDWRVAGVLQQQDEFSYFAYGSAMDDKRFVEAGMEQEFQNVVGVGVLNGYQLRFTRHSSGGGRADVMELGGRVEGKVYRVKRMALDYLFRREGVGIQAYRPAIIDIEVNGKMEPGALVFLNVNKEHEICPPDWYVTELLRGGEGWLSQAYLDGIRQHVMALKGQV